MYRQHNTRPETDRWRPRPMTRRRPDAHSPLHSSSTLTRARSLGDLIDAAAEHRCDRDHTPESTPRLGSGLDSTPPPHRMDDYSYLDSTGTYGR